MAGTDGIDTSLRTVDRRTLWAHRFFKFLATQMNWEYTQMSNGVRLRVSSNPYLDFFYKEEELITQADAHYALWKVFKEHPYIHPQVTP